VHPLLKRQVRKAFGADPPDSPQLRAFIDAVGDAYAAADDDRHQLEHSIELASGELFERNSKLQRQLAVMTQLEQAVDRKNRDMKLILDHVAQGLVTVGLDGAIRSECSSALVGWFGVPGEGTPSGRCCSATIPSSRRGRSSASRCCRPTRCHSGSCSGGCPRS